MVAITVTDATEPGRASARYSRGQAKVFFLTFIAYACFHLTRKVPSVVKPVLHPAHTYDVVTNPGWPPFNQDVSPEAIEASGYDITGTESLISGHFDCMQLSTNLMLHGKCSSFVRYYSDAINGSAYLAKSHVLAFEPQGACNSSWLIFPHSPDGTFWAQLSSVGPLPVATIDDEGSWMKCKGDCDCVEAEDLTVLPAETNGNILLGEIDTVFLGFYSVGLFVSGHLGDQVDRRLFLSFGMVGAGLSCSMIGLAHAFNQKSFTYFAVMNAFAGLFQSIGWPCVVAVMGQWFDKNSRGLVMGVWNANTSIGNILGSVIAAACMSLGMHGNDWPAAFIIPGFIMVAVGVIIFLFLEPEPPTLIDQDLTETLLPSGQNETNSSPRATGSRAIDISDIDQSVTAAAVAATSGGTEVELVFQQDETMTAVPKSTTNQTGTFLRALAIPGVATYAISLAFAKLTAYSLLYWGPYYLTHVGFSPSTAGFLSSFFDVGGIIGGVSCGFISDRYKLRASVAFGGLAMSVPAIYFYYQWTSTHGVDVASNIIAMIIVGAFINGPYALITTAVAADLGSHPSLRGSDSGALMSSVTGILDGTGSVGAMVQGVLIGLISTSSWLDVFRLLMVCNSVSAVLLLRLVVTELSSNMPVEEE